MDVAYDHIQEEVLSPDDIAKKEAGEKQKDSNLNAEFQEAYKSFSSSPWGARLGGFFSDVKKQGETYYEGARQEATAASGEALKGFTDLRSTLVNRARSMSTGQSPPETPTAADPASGEGASKETTHKERSESEALRDSEGVISRFRTEAAKRLKDLERAEEAADAAIFKFGANIGNFLKEAVTIAPPTEETNKDGSRKVLFESKDQDGKRVIHTTRFEAQLHAIHSSIDSFSKDPVSPEYEKWKSEFDVEKKTDAIATDLEKYEELRRTMEKLVPEKVEYPTFWTRYYFLRMVVETEEQRRREMLKGKDHRAALSPAETIGWDDDSDDDDQPSTPQKSAATATASTPTEPSTLKSSSSSITIHKADDSTPDDPSLKPAEPRRSQDQHSQADSDASYDLVSGATSRAPGSPKEARGGEKDGKREEDDEEEDWE
ncbi:hypothetical protein MMC28_006346 [Mycoblastus sanguinarius]|nr:hypothetical protein [Mycoblastus sanguinarius]